MLAKADGEVISGARLLAHTISIQQETEGKKRRHSIFENPMGHTITEEKFRHLVQICPSPDRNLTIALEVCCFTLETWTALEDGGEYIHPITNHSPARLLRPSLQSTYHPSQSIRLASRTSHSVELPHFKAAVGTVGVVVSPGRRNQWQFAY